MHPWRPQHRRRTARRLALRLTKARLHFVTGKGGTGKSTVAAAGAHAAGGRRVLLVEVEGRWGIAQLFDVPPLPYEELKIATADGGGWSTPWPSTSRRRSWNTWTCSTTWGIAGRAMRRIGAIEFATTIAPGLRDVLLTGKIGSRWSGWTGTNLPTTRSSSTRRPPGGSRGSSTSPRRFPELARAAWCTRRPRAWSRSCIRQTAIHLVTLLEALPIQETIEAIDDYGRSTCRSAASSSTATSRVPAAEDLAKAADGDIDADAVRAATVEKVGIETDGRRLRRSAHRDHRARHPDPARAESAEALDEIDVPRLELPAINDGVDLGSLYELAQALAQQGSR